jgi:tetratricopeptide (TPR) repeat protein
MGYLSEIIQTYGIALEQLRADTAASNQPEPANRLKRRTLGKLFAIAAATDIVQGQFARAYAEAQEAVAISVETGGIEGEVFGNLVLAVAHLAHGFDNAPAQIQHVLALARAAQERGVASEMLIFAEWRCFYWMAWDANRRGDVAAARQWARDGLAVSERLGTPRGELNCLEPLLRAELELHDDAAAHQCLERIQQLSRPNDYPSSEGIAQHGHGELLAGQRRYAEARRLMEQSLATFHLAGDGYRETVVLASLIRVLLALGDTRAAQMCIEQFDGLVKAGLGQYNAVVLELARALLAEHTGDNTRARAAAARALAMARLSGQRRHQADALVILGHSYERTRRWQRAARAYADALACYEGLGHSALASEPATGLRRVALRRQPSQAV